MTLSSPKLSTLGALVALLGGLSVMVGCGTDGQSKADTFGYIDTFIEPDGLKPWFRDGGGCGSGGSGVSGNCDDGGGVAKDAGVPDLPKPDICVPPATWTCEISFSFPKQGSESTGGVHGDWDVFDGKTFSTKAATLSGNNWTLTVSQENGKTLTYKFVVDEGLSGEKWFHDPNNPNKVSDGYGGFNSQLSVSCPEPCSR